MTLDHEIMVLLLASAVTVFVLRNRRQLSQLPVSPVIMGAFYVLLAGWILTVVEGFFWNQLLNVIEHLCYVASALLLFAWCCLATGKEEGRQ